MQNILEDVSTLTSVPQKYLNKLTTASMWSICDSLTENKETQVHDFDIGLGTLSLFITDDSVKYKFVPSKNFEESVKYTIKTGQSPVLQSLENTAILKILDLYRDLL